MKPELVQKTNHSLPPRIEVILKTHSRRFGQNPLYIETNNSWKIWDRRAQRWIEKLK